MQPLYQRETIDGAELRISRREGAPLILLVRMATGGMGLWDAVWPFLAERFTVANFDLIEAAVLDQDVPPRARFMAMAEATAAMATRLGHERFHVFGWNGGCHIAQAAMARFPDRVAGAILLDPFFELPDMRRVWAGVDFKRALYLHPDRALYARYFAMAGFSPGFMEKNFDLVERMVENRLKTDRFITQDVAAWERWLRALRTNWQTEADFAAMARVPARIVATELDSWHAGPTPGMADALAAHLPLASVRVVRGYGNFFFIEAPDEFAAATGDFLPAPG